MSSSSSSSHASRPASTRPPPPPIRQSSFNLTAGITRGLASLAGTAATVAGNVRHLGEEVLDPPASPTPGTPSASESRFRVRATVGNWLGRGSKRAMYASQDRITLFPGYALREPTDDGGVDDALETDAQILTPGQDPRVIEPFDITLHVSGFCTSLRPPEAASLVQRTFSRLAMSIAALPPLPAPPSARPSQSSATREASSASSVAFGGQLLESPEDERSAGSDGKPFFAPDLTEEPDATMPSGPETNITPPTPVARSTSAALLPIHRTPSRAASTPPKLDRTNSTTASLSLSEASAGSPERSLTSASATASAILAQAAAQTDLHALHANLKRRLEPFFASVIPDRPILIEVRPRLVSHSVTSLGASIKEKDSSIRPLVSMTLRSTVNGAFAETIRIPWDTIVESPECLEMIFPEKILRARGLHAAPDAAASGAAAPRWELEVKATLLPHGGGETPPSQPEAGEGPVPSGGTAAASTSTRAPVEPSSGERADAATPPLLPVAPHVLTSTTFTPLSDPKGIRVISDLDDTIKRTDLMSGLREVFRNVFCRPLADQEVPGMGALYRSLLHPGLGRGVQGFHYVSNSPFELFEPIHGFLVTHGFPAGFSLRLKFYGGKSMFKGIWEPAGERKMNGVLEILDAFPRSRFIMFGDSAEQDLDLYSAIADDRPHQIIGIFIRDVSTHILRSASTASSLTSSPALQPSSSAPSSPRLDTVPLLSSTEPGLVPNLPASPKVSSSGKLKRISSSLSLGRPSLSRSSTAKPSPSPAPASSTPSSSSADARSRSASVSSSASASAGLVNADGSLDELALAASLHAASSAPLFTSPPSAQPNASAGGNGNGLPAADPPAQDVAASAEEAMTSARIKAIKRAEDFRARFDGAQSRLAAKGVLVRKFREVAEVEEEVRALVFGKEGKEI